MTPPVRQREVLVRQHHGSERHERRFPSGRKASISIIMLALVSLLVTVASSAATKQKSGLPASLTIGVLEEMSGSAAFCGTQELQGMALAVKEAKRSHFLGKTSVAIKLYDEGGKADNAVVGAHALIDANVAGIVGPCVAGPANVSIPVTSQAGMPQIITTASAADISPASAFRAGIPQPRYASNVIKLLAKRGVKKVAVFYDSGQPSIAGPVWNQTQKVALKALNIEVVDTEAAPVSASGSSDFSSQVAKLIQSKPEAIGVLLQGAPNVTVVNQLRQAGFKGTIWGQQGMDGPFFIGSGPNVNGVLISVSFAAGIGPVGSRNFTTRFEQRYPGVVPTELSAHGYDAMWMMLRGIKAANSTDHAKIIAALAKIKTMPGGQGVLRFNALGDAVGSGFVAEVKDGKLIGVSK
jgi:branched-chain amino acid transport system substrate-binding protein